MLSSQQGRISSGFKANEHEEEPWESKNTALWVFKENQSREFRKADKNRRIQDWLDDSTKIIHSS